MIRISFLCIEPLRKPFFMRAADVDDLILNTLGGAVGCGIHTEKGKTDPFYAELDRICSANKGLWCKEAEDYLLAHAPKVEIGEPKELVKERIIRLGD